MHGIEVAAGMSIFDTSNLVFYAQSTMAVWINCTCILCMGIEAAAVMSIFDTKHAWLWDVWVLKQLQLCPSLTQSMRDCEMYGYWSSCSYVHLWHKACMIVRCMGIEAAAVMSIFDTKHAWLWDVWVLKQLQLCPSLTQSMHDCEMYGYWSSCSYVHLWHKACMIVRCMGIEAAAVMSISDTKHAWLWDVWVLK